MRDKIVPILLALLSLVVSGYVGYSNNDKAVAVEIATLKTQRSGDKEQLDRIERTVNRLENKVDDLLRDSRGPYSH